MRTPVPLPEFDHVIVFGVGIFIAFLLAGLLGAVCTGGC